MSIIQDALKKAQSCPPPAAVRPKIGQVKEVSGLRPPFRQAAQSTKKPPAPNMRPLLTAALLIILAASIFFVVHFLSKKDAKPDKASAVSPQDKASAAYSQQVSYKPLVKDAVNGSSAAASAETLKAATPPDLVLNGIMYLDKGPRALINNFIFGPGESVSGAKIKEINRQSVILEYENTEITLKLN
jgi:type II secretory pathway component PulC